VIVKADTANSTVPPPKEDEMEILKSRYARGDTEGKSDNSSFAQLKLHNIIFWSRGL
jgi:hypothetical protein